jgi:hypothetical protein
MTDPVKTMKPTLRWSNGDVKACWDYVPNPEGNEPGYYGMLHFTDKSIQYGPFKTVLQVENQLKRWCPKP